MARPKQFIARHKRFILFLILLQTGFIFFTPGFNCFSQSATPTGQEAVQANKEITIDKDGYPQTASNNAARTMPVNQKQPEQPVELSFWKKIFFGSFWFNVLRIFILLFGVGIIGMVVNKVKELKDTRIEEQIPGYKKAQIYNYLKEEGVMPTWAFHEVFRLYLDHGLDELQEIYFLLKNEALIKKLEKIRKYRDLVADGLVKEGVSVARYLTLWTWIGGRRTYIAYEYQIKKLIAKGIIRIDKKTGETKIDPAYFVALGCFVKYLERK